MIFWLVLNLKMSYRVINYLEGFWVSFRGFFEDYISYGEIFEFP
jgi:hypothetical protein